MKYFTSRKDLLFKMIVLTLFAAAFMNGNRLIERCIHIQYTHVIHL